MSIKTILFHAQEKDNALPVACKVARDFSAHLIGLHVIAPPQIPSYAGVSIPPEIFQQLEREAEQKAEKIRERFEKAAKGEDILYEWRLEHGYVPDQVALQARYADLTVVSQDDPDTDADIDVAGEIVMTVRRPLLIVPYVGDFRNMGQRIMIAWDGSAEASRSVHDAMPFLERAEQVIVFSVNPPESDHEPGADICTHLARHGVNAEARHTIARDISVGDAILDAISDMSIDMLVMGAYGHSRIRELVFGGATRHLLEHMTVPVMMSR